MFTELVKIGSNFLASCSGSAKKSKIFDISPSLHNSSSRPWLLLSGNCPVVSIYDLVVITSHLVLYCYCLVYKHLMACHSHVQGITSREAIDTNQAYLKGNRPVINIPGLIWFLAIKTGCLQVFGHRVYNTSV